jgi:hypothetical protein
MQKIFFLVIITFLLSIFLSIIVGSSAVGVSLIIFLFSAIYFCYLLGKKKKEDVNNLLIILFVTFPLYLLYVLLVNANYVESNSFFLYPDQYGLFQDSEDLGNNNSIIKIYQLCFIDRIHYEMEGFYFLMGVISYISNTFFEGNSVLLQSIHISFLAILTNLLMYKFLKNNGVQKNILKYTIIYAILSPIFFYSPWILRDIHIAFLFMVGFVLISSKFSFKNLLLLLFIIFLVFEFRVENALFMIIFVPYYIIFKARSHRYFKLATFSFVLILIISLPFLVELLIPKFANTITLLENYETYTLESLENQGLGRYLYRLPFGLKHIAIVLYSQITHFPPWAIIEISQTPYQLLIGIIALVKSVFWSLLFILSVISFFFKNARKKLDISMLVLLFFFILYLFLNSSNINDRRLLAMYPILFLYVSNLKNSINKKLAYQLLKIDIFIYFVMLSFYFFIKFV